MIVRDLIDGESNATYQALQITNQLRQYDFLEAIVNAALQVDRPVLSQTVIKSLNYHAIACLHASAGEYRPCRVSVGLREKFTPPEHYQVPTLMDDFVNFVNRYWYENTELFLAAYVLWRLNYIHPFINGNGRTARASCYFVICLKKGLWLPSKKFLPQLISDNRPEYIRALKKADENPSDPDLHQLETLIYNLLLQQYNSS